MDLAQLTKALEKSPPKPVYLIAGEEEALVDRAVELISKRVLAEVKEREFALTRLDGATASAEEVEIAARTASLFGGRRLVVVRECQRIKEAELTRLLQYLEKPVSTTTLLLVARGFSAGSREPGKAKAAKLLKKMQTKVERGAGEKVDCPKPKARELPWLAERMLEEQGLRSSRYGVHALVEAVGEDLGALERAVVKLTLFLGGQGEVREEHVAEVVADTRSQSVFALADAVGEGALDRALRILASMTRDGENALTILALLSRHFRNLARVSALTGRGQNADSIRKQLGLHPFVVKKSLAQSRRFSTAALTAHLERLARTDWKLKSSPLPNDLQLQELLTHLCRK